MLKAYVTFERTSGGPLVFPYASAQEMTALTASLKYIVRYVVVDDVYNSLGDGDKRDRCHILESREVKTPILKPSMYSYARHHLTPARAGTCRRCILRSVCPTSGLALWTV